MRIKKPNTVLLKKAQERLRSIHYRSSLKPVKKGENKVRFGWIRALAFEGALDLIPLIIGWLF